MLLESINLKVEQKDSYVACYLLQTKVTKEDMLVLVKILADTLEENKRPVTLNFPNIGFEYIFESLNDILNFEKTIKVFIPYVIDRIVAKLEEVLDEEKVLELVPAL